MIQLEEHDCLKTEHDERFEHLRLVSWDRPKEGYPFGYYASFKIGAEWIDDDETIVVTTKRGIENIDFLKMFMTCFSSDLALESFSKIYEIDVDKPTINAPSLQSVISPLVILHFLSVVGRIKSLKKGYVHYDKNLKKVKGAIRILKNERDNIITRRFDRIYCGFDEYTADIPENRLIKKAVLFSRSIINRLCDGNPNMDKVNRLIKRILSLFESVSDDVSVKDVGLIKQHKIFSEYAEAIRLAKIVLKCYDFSIKKAVDSTGNVTPFVLDMSLLYEHYVYGMLNAAYGNKIQYQFCGKTGKPDFLYCSSSYKAILDTKYIPKYAYNPLDTYVVRQLSGYSRDLPILERLGYVDIREDSPIPTVPCVIIYPTEDDGPNPFEGKPLKELCVNTVRRLSQFYEISVPVPTLR